MKNLFDIYYTDANQQKDAAKMMLFKRLIFK